MTRHHSTTNPMGREWAYGKLRPMPRPEGEPSVLAGVAVIVGVMIVAVLLVVIL